MVLEVIGHDGPLSWEEFENETSELMKDRRAKLLESRGHRSHWIFRGQSNSKWKLRTSLERYLGDELYLENQDFSVDEYYRIVASIVSPVNTMGNHNFPEFVPLGLGDLSGVGILKHLSLLYFLRHHGFPSPLLDWSYSYYVAAFFAFDTADTDADVAIYAFQEFDGEGKTWGAKEARIASQGHYVQTHRRHYLQQSVYTVCFEDSDSKRFVFVNHEDTIETKYSLKQDKMKKFIINGKERRNVLRKLDLMNINSYTLFGSEESLLRSLAFRYFSQGGFN